jgi:hypothetical protein
MIPLLLIRYVVTVRSYHYPPTDQVGIQNDNHIGQGKPIGYKNFIIVVLSASSSDSLQAHSTCGHLATTMLLLIDVFMNVPS